MDIDVEALQPIVAAVNEWIDVYIGKHLEQRIPVAELGFPRLPDYYSGGLLSRVYTATVKQIEMPPLGLFGLDELSSIESGSYSGITYKDTYFVAKGFEDDESLHFHELIHIIQWDELGAEGFISVYGAGLLQNGYRMAPLEVMAYDLQKMFEQGRQVEKLEEIVRQECRELADIAMMGPNKA